MRFTGSWAVALRMARRDVRRHKGRSALILVMVALPTALLTFAMVAASTSQVSGAEVIPGRMGNGVAMVEYPQPQQVLHPPDPGIGSSSRGDATPIPGWVEGGSVFDNADAMSRLTGARAVPLTEESLTTRRDGRRLDLQSLSLDLRTGVTDKVTLVDGRIPERAGEVLVTTMGLERGLPASGTLGLRAGDKDVDVTVVGTARVLSEFGGRSWNHLVTPQPLGEASAGGGWILLDNDPVGWDEVTALNKFGLTVWSAEVLRDPPPASALDPEIASMADFDRDRMGTFLAIGGALLLVITTLLVGPAFAVSAARQRRALALSASNGATTGQLRHTVLAQALVLGSMAAAIGAALGVGAAWGLAQNDRLSETFGMSGPFEIPLLGVLATTLVAMTSAVIAALLPARRLGRLDIIGVMKGQSVSPRPSVAVLVVGAVMAGLGGFALISLARSQAASGTDGGQIGTVAAAIALVVGAVMLAPMILVGLARVSSRLPVSLRMATRDAGRQRARSVPAIAAILAGVAVLTMVLIASGSDEEQSRREYTAQNLEGDTSVHHESGGIDADTIASITDGFRSVRPGLVVAPVGEVDTGDSWMYTANATPPTKPYDTTTVNVVPPGCTPEATVYDATPPTRGEMKPASCQVLGTNGMGNGAQITVTTADEISRRLATLGREDDAAAVRKGAVVVGRPEGQPSLLTRGTVTVMSASLRIDPQATTEPDPATALTKVRTVEVPAIEVPLDRSTIGAMLGARMLTTPESASSHGWPTRTTRLTVHDPAGPMSQDLTDRLGFGSDDAVYLYTERGFQSDVGRIVAVLVGLFVLLLLVITLTSTALTLAEQENDQATLAALGSGRGTRRVMAAAQAFTLCIIGAVLGVAVGIVPGIALAYPLTAQSWDAITGEQLRSDPILVFPWLVLAGFAVAVPVVAAGLAAAGIRKAPDATHRTA
ncbi:FtsX-like permease family protein [Knoellia sp. LjRoot47]|uniref:FtsX-like permease family protein n=1 Tax=Knoellia sp. LjRoot47 TaxID=3342330 RepID=UPI003ECC86F0